LEQRACFSFKEGKKFVDFGVCKIFVSSISETNDRGVIKKLTLITPDGKAHSVKYNEMMKNDLKRAITCGCKKAYEKFLQNEQANFCEINDFTLGKSGDFVEIFHRSEIEKLGKALHVNLKGKEGKALEKELVALLSDPKTEEKKLDNLAAKAVADAKRLMADKEASAERRAKYGARVFHVITGILVTPTEMASGVLLLALSTAKVALGRLVLLGIKRAQKNSAALPGNVREQKINRAHLAVSSFTSSAVRDVQIALLKMVPVIGAALANQYIATGSVRGFIGAPAFGGLLAKVGITIPEFVYGTRACEIFKKKSESYAEKQKRYGVSMREQNTYLSLKKPTI
jgi:hypothetical protein